MSIIKGEPILLQPTIRLPLQRLPYTISNMPIASSQYWNSIHGREKGQAEMDEEGKQTMRVLARNMTFLMKSIELGKKEYGFPETEEHVWTHFI